MSQTIYLIHLIPHKVPSSALLFYNTNHKNYLKTVLLLSHVYDELTVYLSLANSMAAGKQQTGIHSLCFLHHFLRPRQRRPVHWCLFHMGKESNLTEMTKQISKLMKLGFPQLHKHYHTPDLNYKSKIQNRYVKRGYHHFYIWHFWNKHYLAHWFELKISSRFINL